jgi:nitrate reductase (NAD(P)H)
VSKSPEHDWRRAQAHDEGKHHGAYGKTAETTGQISDPANGNNPQAPNGESHIKTEYQQLREKYTREEVTLLRYLQHEAATTRAFQQNTGTLSSPAASTSTELDTSIDSADAMTPDNWIPRSASLIRRTGQHPLNAEPELSALMRAGLVTPNQLHYVRNHGSVPRLYWEEHVLDICDGEFRVGMNDLLRRWESVNVQVALACDGNRRGELNQLGKTKGFDWGPGAVGCAFWRGVRVADVLRSAGVSIGGGEGRRWVNFEGADQPSEGKVSPSASCVILRERSNRKTSMRHVYHWSMSWILQMMYCWHTG